MAELSGSGATRLPVLRPLGETSLNAVRQNNSMAPPTTTGGMLKRKIPTASMAPQPENKVSKPNSIGRSIMSMAGHGHTTASGIARPSSAASTSRHGSSRSIDAGAQKKTIATTGIRPPSRTQPPRPRPATSMGTHANGKSEAQSDATQNKSRTRFSSRNFSLDSSFAAIRARNASYDSGIAVLASAMSGLSIDPHVAPRNGSRSGSSQGKSTAMLGRSRAVSPAKMYNTPKARSKKIPLTPGGYMTKDSNTPVPPVFDVESKVSDFTLMLKDMSENMGSAVTERNAFFEAIEIYKIKISELEVSRAQLEDNNASLRRELDATKSSLSTSAFEADEARRQHLNELDDMRRRYVHDVDEVKRGHRDEMDELRRENKRTFEQTAVAAKDETQQLEKRHQAELETLKRELNWALEEEQRARKRDVQSLQDDAQNAQKMAENGQERHLRDLRDKDERINQLSKMVEREKDLGDDLRKQLVRSGEQNAELENVNRNLKAQVEFLKSDSKSQSQAFADLEQQTQDALNRTEDYRSQLRKEETLRRKLLNQIQDLKGNIRVFCRVRPPLAAEYGSCAQITFPDVDSDCRAIELLGQEEKSSLGKVTTKTHAFNFDRSFGPSSQNEEIFAELSELVAAVCGGSFNTCIFSYGQTGSGKTYTMASPDGMIARAVDQIFDTARDLTDKGWRYTISGSFVEVYNENINDLLGRPEEFDKKKHEIRHNAQTLTTEVTDVTDIELQSSDHFTSVLERALRNRSIAATKANERSSRSHSVCILRLQGQNHMTGESCRSTLNLVDLAGSERLAHSQATGCRLRETQNINKSLSCLADVIAALGEARDGSHIPYRNSKLTYLLQNSLGGNSKTLMFVMVSPLQEHLSETLSSLNFATKVNNTRIIRKQKR